jgi:hypothetical protein
VNTPFHAKHYTSRTSARCGWAAQRMRMEWCRKDAIAVTGTLQQHGEKVRDRVCVKRLLGLLRRKNMSSNIRNKLLVVCLALVASLTLASVGVLLNSLAPAGLVLGLLVRIVLLAIVIPLVVWGFSAACDKCEDLLVRGAQARRRLLERRSVVKPRQVDQRINGVAAGKASLTPRGNHFRDESARFSGSVCYSMRFAKIPALEATRRHGQ